MAPEKMIKAAAGLAGILGQDTDDSAAVPQCEPLNDKQVRNAAGGFAWQLDDMARLRRFLIIGSEGGTYYVTEQRLTLESGRAIKALLDSGRGPEVVAEIVRVSTEGRAPKQTPGIFALALACRLGDQPTKAAAYAALSKVARTASTLFDFLAYSKAVNQELATAEGRTVGNASWGRGMRHAVANWYLDKNALSLAYQVTKYGMRSGWTHRDVLRLSHPKPAHIRTAAQRRAAAAAAGALETLAVQSAPAGGDEDEWALVDAPSPTAAAADAPAAADAAASAADAVERKVADMQLLFDFIVKDEAVTAGEGAAKLEGYLAAAHRLKKAKASDITAAAGEGRTETPPEAAQLAHQAEETTKKRKAKVDPAAGAEEVKRPRVEGVTIAEACALITKHRFSREHVGDTRLLKQVPVWQALLGMGMPFTALTRSLGRLTALGMFEPLACPDAAANLAAVCSRFSDVEGLRAARAHPITLLNALRVYAKGHGDRGSLTWEAEPKLKTALEAGFYASFRNVEPTGKRFLLGVDVSASMNGGECAGMQGLTPRDAATSVAMCLKRTETCVHTMAFTDTFLDLKLEKADTLEDALRKSANLPFSSTDCSLPMTFATQRGLKVDVFVVLTDNDTWCGTIHASEALKRYRRASGIADARLLVLAVSGNGQTIADPEDPLMLDVAGMDSGVPEVMRQFVLGQL